MNSLGEYANGTVNILMYEVRVSGKYGDVMTMIGIVLVGFEFVKHKCSEIGIVMKQSKSRRGEQSCDSWRLYLDALE